MAKTAKKENVGIELPKLKIQIMDVTIIGDEPLIVHSWSVKSKRNMLDVQMKVAQPAKAAKDPMQDFRESLYELPDGGYGFPAVGFKAAAVMACTSTGGVTKVAARQAFHVLGEGVDIEGAFPGTMKRESLVRVQGGEPRMREDMVRIGMGTADLRYRGEFWPWHAMLTIRHNANVLSAQQIVNLINTAGFGVGVGEWRPERDGAYGMFHVATEAEMRKLEAAQLPKAA